jgi:hypothetical protein
MKVKPILNPLDGEGVIAVDPPLKPNFEADWRRRLNLYNGRSLSDTALTLEQDGRAGRLATRGQMVSAGVVSGLEIDVERVAHTPTPDDPRTEIFFYKINAGFGLAATGEDVILPRKLQVDSDATRVYATTTLLAGEAPGVITPHEAPPARRALEARTLGPRLGDLSAEARALLPLAGILVLQPVVAEVAVGIDDTDPCEQDPQNFAFEDWELIDGARLVLYAWPREWVPLPDPDSRWRNRLAYTIFGAEANLALDELLPWEDIGVPIALVGFSNELKPVFTDRFSVVRSGGKPKRRTPLIDSSGSVFLWQARLQQFAEQITDPRLSATTPIRQIASQFRHLPPAGLLTRPSVEFIFSEDPNVDSLARDHFFPSNYTVEGVPVPIEQLDAAIEASAALTPFDTFTGDQVQLLVPVPEIWYEPQLLKKERVAPAFQEAIDRFTERQTELLHRRKDVRAKADAIGKGITSRLPVYTDPDPDGTITLNPVEDEFGTRLASADPDSPRVVTAIEDLKTTLRGQGAFLNSEVDKLDDLGLEPFIRYLDDKASRADDLIDFGFLTTQSDIYRVRQQMLGNTAGTRLATSPALASIAKGESALATRESLRAFTQQLRSQPPPTTPSGLSGAQETGPTFEAVSGAGAVEMSSAGRELAGAGLSLAGPLIAAQPLIGLQPLEISQPAMTASQAVSIAASGTSQLFQEVSFRRDHVLEQSPIIGEFIDFRTVAIAARLQEPESAESRRFAVSSKHEVVSSLTILDLSIDDIEVPGVVDTQAPGPTRPNVTFGRIKDPAHRARILGEILNGVHDPVPANADEAAYFSVAVRALDHTIGILRKVEGRVQSYRIALAVCRTTLNDVRVLSAKAAKRLQELEDGLAETRHDLAVATALLVEERGRVSAINDRRRLVIEKHVSFFAYRRPRTADLLADVPVRALEPGLTEAPVPACLGREVEVRRELRAMVELLRQVPIKWLVQVHPLLDKLDRLDILRETVQTSVARAQLQLQPATASTGLLTRAIDSVLTAQHAVITKQRVGIANLNLGEFFGQNWKVMRERARDAVSLASLIEAGHGRSDVAAQATRELNDITHVASCLYEMFGDVLPAIRLDWAERLSQFDEPVNLRNLSSLPHWGDKGSDGEDLIPFLDRRQMQILADWIYQRVDPAQPEAVALIDDVVRVSILLASHAPVNQIVSGHVTRPTTVTRGGRVELRAGDASKVRVGMHVLMYSGTEVVARGRVNDLSAAHVTAEVVHTVSASVSLAENARVEFGDPDSFDRAAIKVLRR